MGQCDGKVALVTGASRGIGVAIAERLAAEGATVVVTARSLEEHPHLPGTLRETMERIAARGGKAVAIQADLVQAADRARLHEEAVAQVGPIDILVNNAAASFYFPFEKYSANRLHVAVEINIKAPFELAQRVVPGMRARGRGWILNIGSRVGDMPEGPPFNRYAREGGALVYGLTKAALNRFTVGLAAELQEAGIAVNCLMPVAAVITPGLTALGVRTEGVVVESPETMAEAALALCTADPHVLTGRIALATPLLEELGLPTKS